MSIPVIQTGKPIVDTAARTQRISEIKYWRASERVDQHYLRSQAPDGHKVVLALTCESETDYSERIALTRRSNFIRPFARRYNQAVFRHQPQRTLTPTVERLLQDADGRGKPLDKLMTDALFEAQIAGQAAVVLEATTELPPDATVAQVADANEAFVLRLIKAENILAIGRSEEGIEWVMLLFYDGDGDGETDKTWVRLYTDFDTQDFMLRDTNTLIVDEVLDPVPHGLEELPVAIIEPEPGSSQIAAWADVQRAIHNTDSFLRLELTTQTFTRWILTGVQGADEEDGLGGVRKRPAIQWGSRRIFSFEDPNIKVERLSSDVSQADSLRDTIRGDTEDLYRLAGLQANYAIDGQPQSGFSRLLQLEDFAVQADQLADSMEAAENKLLRLVAITESTEEPEVVYSRDFSEASFEASAERLEKLGGLIDAAYPPETAALIRRELVGKLITQNFGIEVPAIEEQADTEEA